MSSLLNSTGLYPTAHLATLLGCLRGNSNLTNPNQTVSLHSSRKSILHPVIPMLVDNTAIYPSCSSQKFTSHRFLEFHLTLNSSLSNSRICLQNKSQRLFSILTAINLVEANIILSLSQHSNLQTGLPTFAHASLTSIFHTAACQSTPAMAY